MSDDDILNKGGTQEDINDYAYNNGANYDSAVIEYGIEILEQAPIIFTKDIYWFNNDARYIKLQSGSMILLPKDAVLLKPPITNKGQSNV